MSCHLTHHGRSRPLLRRLVVVELIGGVAADEGLRVRAALDKHSYEGSVKVSDADLAANNLKRDDFHGEWNYRVGPRTAVKRACMANALLLDSQQHALVAGAAGLTVIDEVQSAPALLPALEREVDRDPMPGRFLLTGSANVFMLPRVAESLAGRMEVLTLEPLSQIEVEGSANNLVDALFDAAAWTRRTVRTDRSDVVRRLLASGFPQALDRAEPQRRDAWFRAYLSSLLRRDVRDCANIEGLHDLPRLLSLLAARTSALLNMAEVSRATRIAHSTLHRYLALLEALFIVQPLPAWSANLGKRLVKAPKLHLIDAGLAAHLQGHSDPAALAMSPQLGPLLETFAVQEIRRQLQWADTAATAWHFRTAAGREVDLVLEAPGRRIVGVEVKEPVGLWVEPALGLQRGAG